MAQATTLRPGQIRHLLRVTTSTSRHPERDCLVLLLGLTAGMRVTEIAQIEVQDVLFPSGALRAEISLRAAITKGCRQRCIYLGHAKAIEAIDRYLDFRIAGCLRTTDDPSRYRGLEPSSKLILTRKGYKFHLNTKRRVSWAGGQVDYLACDSL
jgi:integrase/recombinase XerD